MMLFSVKFGYVILISEINCFQIEKEIKTLFDIFHVFKQFLAGWSDIWYDKTSDNFKVNKQTNSWTKKIEDFESFWENEMFTEIIHGYEIGKKECLRETIPSVVNGDRLQIGKVRVIRILHDINCHLYQNSTLLMQKLKN